MPDQEKSKVFLNLDIEIRKHYAKWISHAEGLLKQKEDAEDMVQEILRIAVENGTAIRVLTKDKTIYYYICRAIWLRCKREVGKRSNARILYIEVDAVDEGNDFNYFGENFDVVKHWLSDYEMKLVELWTTDGVTMRDISRATEIPIRTLCDDMDRIKRKIKTYVPS